MDTAVIQEQVIFYQKATSQQERDDCLYQIAISSNLLRAIEVEQITRRKEALSEEQRQRVLGFIEVYFGLDLGSVIN